MRSKRLLTRSLIALAILVLAVSVSGQVHKYFTPGTVWQVTMIRIHSGMDQAYLQYLDTELKKESEASIKGGFMKSYKILRSRDDDSNSWNMLIMREYDSYASMEQNAEKADAAIQKAMGTDDQKNMQGYMDRSKVRDIVGIKTMQEVTLK